MNLNQKNKVLLRFLIVFSFVISFNIQGNCQNYALTFNGINDYISFGNDTNLQLENFTVECWFKRTGLGDATNTGTSGAIAIPLVTKGRAESDGNERDLNYFLGIDSVTNVLTTDVEEGDFQHTPGFNHPVYGTTPILWNVWYHAAMTFNGNVMSIYLNGQLEISVGLGVKTQSRSTQYAGVAAGLTSFGYVDGHFKGAIDEVRIWNYARDIREIQNHINESIQTPQQGLVASWNFNEGSGAQVFNSAGLNIPGALYGTGFNWTTGAPLNLDINYKPDYPETLSPLNNDTCTAVNNTVLQVHANDLGGDTLTVKFFGRPAFNSPPPFSIVPIPDTQFYVSDLWGGSNDVLKSQTNWIVANLANRNIQYVTQLGDCVQNGDNAGDDTEWKRADTSFTILENPVTTGLPEGIPFSICVGNHDQTPKGSAAGTTNFYNQYFGTSRFGSRSYYGGHFGNNNDNHFSLFSGSGMDFIEVSLEFDGSANPNLAVLNWADSVIQAYPSRHAIVSSHYILNVDGTFGNQGQEIYDHLKHNSNLFLMLCAHMHDENYRSDIFNGDTIYTILSDYQARSYGGYGWLKILEFSPEWNKIFVRTYSPFLDMYETDWNSEFALDFPMTPQYQLLGTMTVAPGSDASFLWSGLQMNASYEWYAIVDDGTYQQFTTLNHFSTNNNEQVYAGADAIQCGGQITIGTTDTNYTYVWSNGNTNSLITVNQTGNYILTATSIAGNCSVKDTVQITINTIPESGLGPDTAVCKQLVLGASTSPYFIYIWQDASSDSIFTAVNSGFYSLYIEDSTTGCYSSDTVNVIIYPLPIVNLGTDTTQCGGIIEIGMVNPANTYLWSNGSTDSLINVSATGQYILNVTSNIGGCVNSDTINITINPIPYLELGTDTSVCGQIVLSGTTGPNFAYQWNDGSPLRELNAVTSGNYSLLLTDTTTGCFKSDSIEIIIFPFPVVNLGPDIIQCGGQTTIGIQDSLNTYFWNTGSVIPEITIDYSGMFALTATSILGGCQTTDSISVTIHPLPNVQLGNDTSGCGQVSVSAYLGQGWYVYSWQNGLTQPEIVARETGDYIVNVQNVLTGCTSSDTINVEIYPIPEINLGSDTLCSKCDFTLMLQGNFQTYLWSTGETSNSIHISAPGNYSVAIVDMNGCTARDSIHVGTPVILYPNPFSDFISINLPASNAVPEFFMYNELAQFINFNYYKNGNQFIINTADLAKGIYFLRIENGNDQYKYKLIKK